MRALVLLLSISACGGHAEDDSYDRRDDSSIVPPDDSGTDDSATGDDSTPPDDSATPVYGLDVRPSNATCLAPARPASDFDAEWEPVFPALSFSYAVQITHPPGDDSWLYVVQQEVAGARARTFVERYQLDERACPDLGAPIQDRR